MELLAALGEWPVAAALRRSSTLYIFANAAHIFSLGLVVGAIVTLDLKVLGLFGRFPAAALAPPLARVAAVGVALAIITGFLLFSVRPAAYAANPAFLTKIALVALGIANALLLRRNPAWQRAVDGEAPTPPVRLAAVTSILIWAGAVLAGRWIGFLD